jgi:pyruvate/2-oxoglutarate dehydrogenase complex dihydrolipoamide dehydrogenase (E3) component
VYRCLQVKNIVIATGGQASRIPIPGAEHAIISDEVMKLPATGLLAPKR